MRKKILIATLNDYIVYQPTILNLYDELVADFDVEIISFEPTFISTDKDISRNIRYIKVPGIIKELSNKVDFIMNKLSGYIRKLVPGYKYKYLYYNRALPATLRSALKNSTADHVIAVDIPALFVCQQVYGKVHFLSLEIDRSNPFVPKIDQAGIRSVFIQNQVRLDHLLPEYKGPAFFIQNAPVFEHATKPVPDRKDFIWAGTLLERFGVIECINFFKAYPEYRLELKGGAEKKTLESINENFRDLIETNVIHINREYLPGNAFLEYLSKFRIGFCFYSWKLINADFNYRTAPSGKLFMYMAAGVPVIACNIPGFSFIKEFNAGVLIDNYEPATILDAVTRIESNYTEYQEACYKVARHFDFRRNAKPYLEFLHSN
jgi:glycosyltransferase involved in cell wall biosynthesis